MRRGAPRLLTLATIGLIAIGLSACSSPKKAGVNGSVSTGQGIGQPSPFLGANLTAISCGSGDLCAAGGAPFQPGITSPVLAYSHTGGIKWSPARTAAAPGATITETACAQARCLAIGIDGGLPVLLSASRSSPTRTWVAASQPSAGTLVSVGCAGTSTCVGLARSSSGALATVRTTAGSWTSLGAPPSDLATPIRMSCSSPKVCTAVGTTSTGRPVVLLTRSSGATWSVAEISKKATVVLGASCRSDGRCWAVGRKGTEPLLAASRSFGTPLLKVELPDGLAIPDGVSCAATTCVVVGADAGGQGAAVASTGATTTILDLSYVPTALLAVSCGSAHACSAVSNGSLVTLAP